MSDLKRDFPVFKSHPELAYLDTASSAQKPAQVLDAMLEMQTQDYANIHRGLYGLSQKSTERYEAARKTVADFIQAPSENNVVFTRNATEAINLVAASWGTANLKSGDEIIISGMEHHANIVPWQLLCARSGAILKVIPVLDDGALDMEAFQSLLSDKTRLVASVHISNALGTVNPVQEIIQTAKKYNPEIITLIDGSQAVVHGRVNVGQIDPDFYAFTGHKLYGPTGIGVLYGREDLLNAMPPYQGGGDMIERVSFEQTTYKAAPAKFEAGTPAFVQAVGLAAAINYITAHGVDNIAVHEHELRKAVTPRLSDIDGIKIYGTAKDKAGIISFTAEWAHHSDIAMILDQCGVAVRSGHHCCMPLMQRFGIDGTVRVSFGLYNDARDCDTLIEGLEKARKLLS